jgi:hypothetical protein
MHRYLLSLWPVIFWLAIVNSSYADNGIEHLQSFRSDGCSAFPDGTLQQNTLWLACCVEHDKAYWLGGSATERRLADEALQVCVNKVGETEIAQIMLAGVRVGGSPYWPTTFRWGYGWPYWQGLTLRGYKVVTAAERQQALRLLSEFQLTDKDY